MNEAEFKAQVDALAAFPEQLKRQLEGLSDAALRSVSPVHLQYLRNMAWEPRPRCRSSVTASCGA